MEGREIYKMVDNSRYYDLHEKEGDKYQITLKVAIKRLAEILTPSSLNVIPYLP